MSKLSCFVDETGPDTEGKFFLVAVILVEKERQAIIEKSLEELERNTKKGRAKWTKTAFPIKEQFLTELASIRDLRGCIYYAVYHDTKEYTALTAFTIAKAVLAHITDEYHVSIVIDGLTKAETEKVRQELKSLKIRYKDIRGMKDEQSVFLRLADCMAGFLRDCQEHQSYTMPLLKHLQQAKIVIEA